MEMIPALVKFGYRYVVCDVDHMESLEPMRWEKLRYRPHIARHGDAEIIVVPRDRELSNAQLSGFDPGWFAYEVGERTKHCTDFPALVTTFTDGENGGWFRNMTESAGFWGWFYKPMLDWQRSGTLALSQISINEYLDKFGAEARSRSTRAPGTRGTTTAGASCSGPARAPEDRHRGAEEGEPALPRASLGPREKGGGPEGHHVLDRAYWHILRAETSCNFFWGTRWIHRSFEDLEEAERLIDSLN